MPAARSNASAPVSVSWLIGVLLSGVAAAMMALHRNWTGDYTQGLKPGLMLRGSAQALAGFHWGRVAARRPKPTAGTPPAAARKALRATIFGTHLTRPLARTRSGQALEVVPFIARLFAKSLRFNDLLVRFGILPSFCVATSGGKL